ncbi:MAG: NAD(+) diphosphatase [Erysipelotrichaceae bacterium]|nr:NAD(+) diphosphatase [Erysipelotrichaceae bacterium]
MIQDICPHRLKNQFIVCEPEPADQLIIISDGKVLLKKDQADQIVFPCFADLKDKNRDIVYLFMMDETRYFRLEDTSIEGFEYIGIKDLRYKGYGPKENIFAIYTAYHLNCWYEDNRYCGNCGSLMVHDKEERAQYCPSCHRKVYPRINPAVIVGVINGDRLLLTRYRNGYGGNAMVAGFTEIGETLEETVKREVKEETGLEVKNIRYYGSQPWGTASDILAGFYCDVDGDDTIRMDENELRYASWVTREDIVLQESDFSLTNEMMKRFKEGKDC